MEETARLTLAFIGEQEVHRNNSRALLEDFVDGWQKQHRKGEVRVVLHDPGFSTETFKDLDDWGGTAGYDVTYAQTEEIIPGLLEEPDARLILVGDPNDDDDLYDVVEEAAKYRIHTRSLINGLEKVVFDDDDFEDDLAGLHEVDVETGEGWADEELTDEAAALLAAVPDVEDVPDDDAPPDLDVLGSLADDGQVEAQEEIKDIAAGLGIDVAPFETWVDAVEAVREYAAARSEEAPAQPGDSDYAHPPEPGMLLTHQEDPADNGIVPDPTPGAILSSETGVSAPTPSSTTVEDALLPAGEATDEVLIRQDGLVLSAPYTREQLEAKTFDEVKAIGLDYGIAPGRGMKHGVYVNKILLASGVETEPPKRKRNRSKKLEVVAEPVAGMTSEAAESDNIHPSNIIPITEVVQGHSLKEIADSLRHYADVLDPPEN